MPALKAHRLRRFRQPFIHFAQTHLRDASKKRRRRQRQRHHGRPDAVGSADNPAGKRDQRHHQNQKRNRAEQVHQPAQQPVEQRIGE